MAWNFKMFSFQTLPKTYNFLNQWFYFDLCVELERPLHFWSLPHRVTSSSRPCKYREYHKIWPKSSILVFSWHFTMIFIQITSPWVLKAELKPRHFSSQPNSGTEYHKLNSIQVTANSVTSSIPFHAKPSLRPTK